MARADRLAAEWELPES